MTDDDVVIKSEENHRLLLPKDWPVERKHGVVSTVPMEQYLSMKFDQVRDRFQQTTGRLDAMEHRLEHLEQDHAALLKRLRLLEALGEAQAPIEGKEVTHGDTTKGSQAIQGSSSPSP